jgi:glycosyltransferase involved in cell wall biosynthesis
LPAFNESAGIADTLDKILAYSAKRGWNAEIIVVDGGSSDGTREIVRGYARKHPLVRLLESPENRGKGYCVRNGMLHAQGEILLFSDADLSSPIEEADKLFAALANGADVAIGSRWLDAHLQIQKQPIHRQLFGRIFNLVTHLILGLDFKDTQCGFKAFTRRSALAIFPLQRIERWGFDPELLCLANKFGFVVSEVAVVWADHKGSRVNPLRDGICMFAEMLRIRSRMLKGEAALSGAVYEPQ